MVVEVLSLSKVQVDTLDYKNVAFKINGADVFDVDGAASIHILFTTLIKGGALKMILNMEKLEFIDSRGIGTIINAAKMIRERKGDIVLVNVPENIERIFKPVNLQRFIKEFPSEQEALNFLKFM